MLTLLIVIVLVVIVGVLVVKFLPRMRAQAAVRRGSHGTHGEVAGSPATYDPATPLEDRYPEDNRV